MIAIIRPPSDIESAVQALVAAAQPWLTRTEGEELARNVVRRGATREQILMSACKGITHRNRHGWLRVDPADVLTIATAMADAWEGMEVR